MRLLPILFSLLLLGNLPAAQPPRVLAWDAAVAGMKLGLATEKEVIELKDLSYMQRSKPVKIKPAEAYWIRVLDAEGPEGAPLQEPVTMAGTVERPLIVILPDKENKSGLRVIGLEDNAAGFKWGSYRLINGTPRALVMRLENKVVQIPVGWKPVDVNIGGETRGFGTLIALKDNPKKPLYSAVWEYDTDVRTLCFLIPGTDPRLSPVIVKAIPESKLALQLDTAGESKDKTAGQ